MEFKEGMEVAYTTSRNYCSGCFIKFSKIAKIFKNGSCQLEDGQKFGKNGNMIKSPTNNYPSGYLVNVSTAREIITRENKERTTREIVTNLLDAIKSKRATYHNIYFLSEEILTDMEMLTNKIKEMKKEI